MRTYRGDAEHGAIDDVLREQAARCADETAKMERGERGMLRTPSGLVDGEFSDAAFGVAAEIAMLVGKAIRQAGHRAPSHYPWTVAAKMLRAGWKRGDKLIGLDTTKPGKVQA